MCVAVSIACVHVLKLLCVCVSVCMCICVCVCVCGSPQTTSDKSHFSGVATTLSSHLDIECSFVSELLYSPIEYTYGRKITWLNLISKGIHSNYIPTLIL